MPEAPPTEPDFGPRGYLPQRAARRARKIILREQLGLGWPLAAVVTAVVLLATAAAFLLTRSGPPGPPFAEVVELAGLGTGTATRVPAAAAELLVVRTGAGVRVFVAPEQATTYCRASGRLEGADGSVWDTRGQRLAGDGASLATLPVQVHAGVVYADTSAPRPAPAPADAGVRPRCALP